ncbi:methyl-accepting chemotaxis protein [Desulfurivibrio dismutans]|uniref:methyl-accepting chemotaxis protein n=1 Tax=Desulfurivibrio dismutans TaxID=1398908 RepID=UPI003D65218A
MATRAAEAAKNTATLIEGTVHKVHEGSELVSRTNQAFGKVADSTTKAPSLVGEIAAASKEQSHGINQLNQAVNDVNSVAPQPANKPAAAAKSGGTKGRRSGAIGR